MNVRVRGVEKAADSGGVDYRARLDRFAAERLAQSLDGWSKQRRAAGESDALELFLRESIEESGRRFHELRDRRRVFNQLLAHAISPEERHDLLRDTLRDLGSSGIRLWLDRRAMDRWLDEAAINERFERASAELQQELSFLCSRLGDAVSEVVARAADDLRATSWRALALEELLEPFLEVNWDRRVAKAALDSLTESLRPVPIEARKRLLSSDFRQRLIRLSQDRSERAWNQTAALDLLGLVEVEPLRIIVQQRLATPGDGDDLFVREHVVRWLGKLVRESEDVGYLLTLASADPSPFVRQAVALQLVYLPMDVAAELWLELAADDEVAVRGAALDAIPALVANTDLAVWLAASLRQMLANEADPTVSRIGIEALVAGYEALAETPELADEWWQDAIESLETVRGERSSIPVRRWASAAQERLWVLHHPPARDLYVRLLEDGVLPRPGSRRRLRKRFFDGLDDETIGRVLSVVAHDDFPLDLERGRWRDRLTRGFRFRFRLWRWLYEYRHPAPDKRQGFRHTVGRVHYGELRAPSAALCELAETKVPGEPLFLAEEAGWRPFLPLVDDCLSTLNQPRSALPVRFFSHEGVTELMPPRSWAGRIRAYVKLNWNFPQYAQLRNWKAASQSSPNRYVEGLQELGFALRFRRHSQSETVSISDDLSVTRHFSAPDAGAPDTGSSDVDSPDVRSASLPAPHLRTLALPIAWPTGLWDRFLDYSLSLYENSLFDLALFTTLLLIFFVARHSWNNRTLRRARRRLGLSVGGWGTRGKSSVERLKAALFNGLGYGVVSKTTGCEAMLLYAHPYGRLRELFLFRPYDKATIWEQRNVVQTAAALRTDVFLWECMGLTPSYVDVLQRQWMQDDLSTLTNTYPDHEDLQGPAGINIPEVMTLFIPPDSRLLASEEQMAPILRDAADAKGTSSQFVGWKEAALVPSDILSRFPYEEHPYNIALVTALASELGVTRAVALKEMADHVVPDLGVLKTYPAAVVKGRTIEFTNGMSANERHGCLGNWKRIGFEGWSSEEHPERWITTLVNNRADRIPRSKVFAKILVEDLSVDRHVLIGGNLHGLVGYIWEAWDEYVAELELWTEESNSTPLEILEATTRQFRQPTSKAAVERALGTMLGACDTPELRQELLDGVDDPSLVNARLNSAGYPEELASALRQQLAAALAALADVDALRAQLATGSVDRDAVTAAYRELLRNWFEQKLVVVEDYYATGDEIVERIAEVTPPNFSNHVFGVQNIKGTGLDFVYRWLAWERCEEACAKLDGSDSRKAAEGIQDLLSFREFGVLAEDRVREVLSSARRSSLKLGGQRGDLDSIEAELDGTLARYRARTQAGGGGDGWSQRLMTSTFSLLEDLLDAGDAVRRRKRADRLYADLVNERVSTTRLVVELQELTKRQKGGWLLKQFRASALYRAFARRRSS